MTVDRSDDLGATWRVVSRFNEPPWEGEAAPRLIVASDQVMWRVSYTGEVMRTTDGGLNWQTWTLTISTQTLVLASLAPDGRLWLGLGGRIYTARDGDEPTPVPARPAPGRVDQLVAVDDTSAYARVDKNKLTWYRTVDSGEHWSKITPPCKKVTPVEFASLARAADDGSLWSFCMKTNAGTGIMTKTLMVSTDDGTSWDNRTVLKTEEGYAFVITPFSRTVAWRSDVDHVFRTEDGGAGWTAVLPDVKGPTGAGLGLAMDPRTAVWAENSGAFWLTTDGGVSWTKVSYPS
jgi:photosystem II stability/assembly factor-like uncharacterized protein